ncbi:MAG: bifunctional riboflavin kinase/FAD synthetase [Thermodesulfobacteriota bacterium]
MAIITSPQEIQEQSKYGTCVTIGNFDGVHVGHQTLIKTLKQRAKQKGLYSVVFTFDPHPMSVIAGQTPPFITQTKQKLELLQEMQPDYILCLHFTQEIANLSPEEFVETYLVKGLNTKDLVIGHDYTFGKGRRGNFELLQQLGELHGFNVEQIQAIIKDADVVSSTRIRTLVQEGRVEEAEPLLGRLYQVSGKVVKGQQRGGPLLGIPTANLEVADELVPKSGVYAVWAEHEGQRYAAVANVGHNPTFGQEHLSVEVHICDFEQDIYGQQLRVHFVKRLREEKKFSGIEELLAQIRADIQKAREVLGKGNT